MLKILLVDDQAIVREGLKMQLSLESEINIVGEANDGASAVKMALALNPDLIIMDIEMTGSNLDGVAAAEIIKKALPQVVIIVLTIHGDKLQREKALKAGVDALVTKTRIEDLLEIIRRKIDSGGD